MKKLLISLLGFTSIITPTTLVVSCSYSGEDKVDYQLYKGSIDYVKTSGKFMYIYTHNLPRFQTIRPQELKIETKNYGEYLTASSTSDSDPNLILVQFEEELSTQKFSVKIEYHVDPQSTINNYGSGDYIFDGVANEDIELSEDISKNVFSDRSEVYIPLKQVENSKLININSISVTPAKYKQLGTETTTTPPLKMYTKNKYSYSNENESKESVISYAKIENSILILVFENEKTTNYVNNNNNSLIVNIELFDKEFTLELNRQIKENIDINLPTKALAQKNPGSSTATIMISFENNDTFINEINSLDKVIFKTKNEEILSNEYLILNFSTSASKSTIFFSLTPQSFNKIYKEGLKVYIPYFKNSQNSDGTNNFIDIDFTTWNE